MKKQIVTILAATCLSLSALAQGSINVNNAVANDPGITLAGLNATSTANATTYYSGTMALQIWYLSGTTPAANINALNGINGTAAYALLTTDGFTEVASVSGSIVDGSFAFSPATVALSAAAPTSTQGVIALVGTEVGGANPGAIGVINFVNNTGGNPNAVPAGTPAILTGWGTFNQNLVLVPTPEPSTMALAGLGGLATLLFRRKK
jgi:hypothetical protein